MLWEQVQSFSVLLSEGAGITAPVCEPVGFACLRALPKARELLGSGATRRTDRIGWDTVTERSPKEPKPNVLRGAGGRWGQQGICREDG